MMADIIFSDHYEPGTLPPALPPFMSRTDVSSLLFSKIGRDFDTRFGTHTADALWEP